MMSKESNHGTFRITEPEAAEESTVWERFPFLAGVFRVAILAGLAVLGLMLFKLRAEVQDLTGGADGGGLASLRTELAALKQATEEREEKAAEERRSIRKSLSGVWHQHDAAALNLLKAFGGMSEEEQRNFVASLAAAASEAGSERVEAGASGTAGLPDGEPGPNREPLVTLDLDLDVTPGPDFPTTVGEEDPDVGENTGSAETADPEPVSTPDPESDLETQPAPERAPEPAVVVKPEPAPAESPAPAPPGTPEPSIPEPSKPEASKPEASKPEPSKPEPSKPGPAADRSTADTYTVQSGDSLSKIAQEHGVSTIALAKENKLRNPNALQIGQVLKIPRK